MSEGDVCLLVAVFGYPRRRTHHTMGKWSYLSYLNCSTGQAVSMMRAKSMQRTHPLPHTSVQLLSKMIRFEAEASKSESGFPIVRRIFYYTNCRIRFVLLRTGITL